MAENVPDVDWLGEVAIHAGQTASNLVTAEQRREEEKEKAMWSRAIGKVESRLGACS